jgi:hypothetical protein
MIVRHPEPLAGLRRHAKQLAVICAVKTDSYLLDQAAQFLRSQSLQ